MLTPRGKGGSGGGSGNNTTTIDVPYFAGINTLHTRNISQSSDGKNFFTRSGQLDTRGPVVIGITGGPLPGRIRQICSVDYSGEDALLVQVMDKNLDASGSVVDDSTTDILYGFKGTSVYSASTTPKAVIGYEGVDDVGAAWYDRVKQICKLSTCSIGYESGGTGVIGIFGGMPSIISFNKNTLKVSKIFSLFGEDLTWEEAWEQSEKLVLYRELLEIINDPNSTADQIDAAWTSIRAFCLENGFGTPIGTGVIGQEGFLMVYADWKTMIGFNGRNSSGAVSISSWPENYAVSVNDNNANGVLKILPYQQSLIAITRFSIHSLVGKNEDGFDTNYICGTGAYSSDVIAEVNDSIVFLGNDNDWRRVYRFNGAEAIAFSQPVETLINKYWPTSTADAPFSTGVGGQYWLFLPNTADGITRAFVYDFGENEWYCMEFPYVITCACQHSLSNDDKKRLYMGTSDGYILKMASTGDKDVTLTTQANTTEITTEAVIGPFDANGNKFEIKDVYLWTNTDEDYSVQLYTRFDRATSDKGPRQYSIKTGMEPMFKRLGGRGRQGFIKIKATDRITGLQRMIIKAEVARS